MNTARSLVFLATLSISLASAAGLVRAETSDWMSGKVVFKYADKLGANGMIVTKMECKDSGERGLGVESALVRLHYKPNSQNIDWRIDGWNNLEENKKYWAGRGFELASYTVFRRAKSGLRLFCTVYNEK
ncbi:hypothetical protein J2045_003740 [Peteryoungia aggregata LMG 23059]|uniref:Uncharacterized protein n=1 Tax=Peteryoungia aggregata LMG 23059 TaxID=1368425 RepID=A0ABU0GBG4_9HYPH|nr:hypothetical protein [Peteryoungia aggregata]MDQ0422690.1 hypothetical protein [Peteryoungia aggregata LMG 23059]